MLRPFADTIPAVTVVRRGARDGRNPGLPIASTHSPTAVASLEPIGNTVRSSASSRSRATSVWGSRPTSLTSLNRRPSWSSTSIWSASATTWLFVTT